MRRYPPVFYCVACANLCFFLGNSFFILLPVYLKNLGASETYIGIINNVDKAFLIISAFALGSLIRGHDRVRMLRQGYLLLLATYGSYLFVDSLSLYLPFIRILHGVGFSMSMIMGSTIVFESVPPDDATEAIGVYGIFGAISNAVSPALGEFLLNQGCPHKLLFMLSAACIAVSLGLTLYMPRQPAGLQSALEDPSGGTLKLLRQPAFALYAAAAFIFGGGFGIIITFLPNFIRAATALNYSWFFVTYIAVLVAIRLFFMRVLTTVHTQLLVALAFLAGTAMNLLLNWPGPLWWLLLTGILYGITHGVLYPVLNAHLVNIAPAAERGRANALFTAIFNGGMMAFAFALGYVIDCFGSYQAAFNVCAAACAAAAMLVALDRAGRKS